MSTIATRILGPGEGEFTFGTRFMIDGTETDSRFALLEHVLEPKDLAGPVHRHSREDEYTFVLEGEVTCLLGEDVVVAGPGTLVWKPRGQWHTFWNGGDVTARMLELVSPAGLENLFRSLGDNDGEIDPAEVAAAAAGYGCELDFDATMPLVEKHRLQFMS